MLFYYIFLKLTSQEWLLNYSLRALGLDLAQLIGGSACKHEITYVNLTKNYIEARYCSGLLPVINIGKKLKHLQCNLAELEKFEKYVINFYF